MSILHDNLPFDQLAREYNFLRISNYSRVLTNLILSASKQFSTPPNVLDVGCGKGICRDIKLQEEIRDVAGEFWGIEPDKGVPTTPGLFFNYQHAVMETAQLPENHFDVVYSCMVMEHVEHPEDFLRAVVRCLKPGGEFIFLTPNARSFVPMITKWCRRFRADELVLRVVRGKQLIEEYHYPVQFPFNTPSVIGDYACRLGFDIPDYAFIEGTGSRSYFPGPLRAVYEIVKLKRKLFKNPRRLATMICRMRKSH